MLMGSAWVVNTVVVVLQYREFARCRKLLHESQVEAGRRGRQLESLLDHMKAREVAPA